MSLLAEIDRRRRLIGVEQGIDLPRSTYICQLLKKALEKEPKGVSWWGVIWSGKREQKKA